MRVARSIAALTLTAVAVLGSAACGKDDPKPARTESTKAAQIASVSPTSPSASQTPTKTSGEVGGEAEVASWLAAAQEAKTYKFTMTLQVTDGSDDASGKIAGSVDMGDPDEPKADFELSGNNNRIKLIVVGKKVYINNAPYTKDKYAVLSSSDESLNYADMMRDVVLGERLAQHADAVLSVEKKGDPIMIDGVSAQPYDVTVDALRMDDDTAGVNSTDGPIRDVFTYYVGPDSLPRRLVHTGSSETVTADYTDWGKPVSVSAPSASQIVDVDPFGNDVDH